jgi:hypothetical protein
MMTVNIEPEATRADRPDATGHEGVRFGDNARGTPTASTSVRHDRIRWGAVWTGALSTLAIYLTLQLLFFALGWLDLGTGSGATAAVVSGVLALIAFFLGGMASGASSLWERANDGMINGVVTWAVTVLGIVALALAGGGALLGSVADIATQTGNLSDATAAAGGVDMAAATQAARETAGWAALALGLTAVASGLGGSVGAKVWPRGRREADRS